MVVRMVVYSLLHHHYLYSYVNLLVKLLKRLLDFKSLLLFLIKCTEKKAAMKDRQAWPPISRLSLPPGLSRLGHPLMCGRRRSLRPTASWAFLHQPLQATTGGLAGGSATHTPPPGLSMHPASMLILDQWSSTWCWKLSRNFRFPDFQPDELAFTPERILKCNSYVYFCMKCAECLKIEQISRFAELNCARLGGKNGQTAQIRQFQNLICQFCQLRNFIRRSCQKVIWSD